MAATYVPLATTTLGSATGTVTFSGISGSYTDLVLITSAKYSSTSSHCLLRFNSDSGTNYSTTYVYGDGTSTNSGRGTSTTATYIARADSSEFGVGITHIQNYSNSTTYKSVLSRGNVASQITIAYAGLWRNTNAITSIDIVGNGGVNFAIGSTFTLYGILSA